MPKNYLLILCICFTICVNAQIINEPPYILTIEELKDWTEDGPTADVSLISSEPLAQRFENTATQLNPELNANMEIAYLPDGMNNFANYGEEQAQFNLYNFTNWSYIDRLVWFGGTASQTVQLPSAPWTNAAHRNGVKVLGNVFFAPVAFGGSTATLNNFLEQDADDNFIVVPIMIEIMQYYNFDGWFVNQETSTNPTTAQRMRDFLEALTTAVEALDKEVMWYDAMLINGTVGWQNFLNGNNSRFVQDNEDGDSSNGFEQRVSSNIFINFFWNSSALPNASRNRANTIGRSSFDVFTGVDVWPDRNQAPFETGGNNWMSLLHEDPTTPYTSFGLFAPNCVFNNSQYSTFNQNPNDYINFYSEERHMFAGADRNPRLVDVSGFRGYSNWVPASSTITQIPFETNFNTGHGLRRFEEGNEISSNPWHNMNEQDILPTWQFAFSENGALTGNWDFDNAYSGGSSLRIEGDLDANSPIDLLLYKTQLSISGESFLDIVYNQEDSNGASLMAVISFVDETINDALFFVDETNDSGWTGESFDLSAFAGEEIATISLQFLSTSGVTDYGINIGQIRVQDDGPLALNENSQIVNEVTAHYRSNGDIILHINWDSAKDLSYTVYSIDGRQVLGGTIDQQSQQAFHLPTERLSGGAYLIQVNDRNTSVTEKLIVR